jgi:glycosyltransferase involved in cell wall biosynthesis
MKVRLVVSPYQMSGLSRYALELSESLPKLGLDLEMIEARPGSLMQRGMHLINQLGPDLGTFWGTYPPYVPMDGEAIYHLTHAGLATSLYLSRPERVVVTVHDIIHYVFRHDAELSTYQHRFHKAADALGLRALHRASAIIAISEYTKGALVEHVGLDPDRIHVVHRSVNPERFKPMHVEPEFWSRHGLDPDLRYVLHLSSDEPRKNVTTLMRAFAAVALEHSDARLLKIGRSQYPQYRQRLVEVVEELALSDRVIFVDYVSEEDLPRFYNMAHAFVLPSLHEGFGLPVLEAMACGCPVTCSDVPPLATEIVCDAGLLVDPASPEALASGMSRLLGDSDAWSAHSEAGLQRAQQFSARREAARTLAVYQDSW